MKIRMITGVVGQGVYRGKGKVYDLPDHEAEQYIGARYAIREAVPPAEKRTTAVKQPQETR